MYIMLIISIYEIGITINSVINILRRDTENSYFLKGRAHKLEGWGISCVKIKCSKNLKFLIMLSCTYRGILEKGSDIIGPAVFIQSDI